MKDSETQTFDKKENTRASASKNTDGEKLTAKEKRLDQRRRIEELQEEKKLKAFTHDDEYYFND
jgi:hypothetical protein